MIQLYDFSIIDAEEPKQKKRLIWTIAIDIILLAIVIVLFCFLSRRNYIYFAIIISLLLFAITCGTFFYLKVRYGSIRNEIKFLNHLKDYDEKVNFIFGFTIGEEIISKNGYNFYVVSVVTKNKTKECYLDVDKLSMLEGLKISKVGVKDRYLTSIEGEKGND